MGLVVVVDIPHPDRKMMLCEFQGGRWDGHQLEAHGVGGRPHDRIWLIDDRSLTATWSTEYIPGACRYRWDGTTGRGDGKPRHIYVVDDELVGS